MDKVTIRRIEESEVETLANGAEEFVTRAKLAGGFDRDTFIRHWKNALSVNVGIIWVCYVGDDPACGLAGYVSPDPNNGDYVFTEAFFYSAHGKEGHGHRLLRHAEKEMYDELGIDRIYMFSRLDFMDDRVATLYHKMGYTPKEIFWEKVLE